MNPYPPRDKRNYETNELEKIGPLPIMNVTTNERFFAPLGKSKNDVNNGKVSSADSGVETGNDSNDGIVTQIYAKNQFKTGWLGLDCETNEYNQMRSQSLPTSASAIEPFSTNSNADDIDQPQSSLSSDDKAKTTRDIYAFMRTMRDVYSGSSVNVHNDNRQEQLRRFTGKMLKEHPKAIRFCPARIKSVDRSQRRMRLSAATNNVESIKKLLDRGISPNNSDEQGRTPLHFAAGRGYTEVVDLLLKHGAEANRKDAIGNTPLHLATVTSKIAVVTLLLEAGTDPLSPDYHGYSPLQLAKLKLRFVQKSRGGDVNGVKSDILEVVNMLTAFLKNRQGFGDHIEALSSSCSRLTLSNSSDEVKNDIESLLASIDKILI